MLTNIVSIGNLGNRKSCDFSLKSAGSQLTRHIKKRKKLLSWQFETWYFRIWNAHPKVKRGRGVGSAPVHRFDESPDTATVLITWKKKIKSIFLIPAFSRGAWTSFIKYDPVFYIGSEGGCHSLLLLFGRDCCGLLTTTGVFVKWKFFKNYSWELTISCIEQHFLQVTF